MHQDFERRWNEAIEKQINKVKYFCNQGNTLPNIAIHEIRKSFKRIRALLQLYKGNPQTSIQKFSNDCKMHGRSISPSRESYVNMQLFDKISENNIIPERKVKMVKESLVQKNKDLLYDWGEGKELKASINHFITAFERNFVFNESEGMHLQSSLKVLQKSYAKSFHYFSRLKSHSTGENWHELRKRMKSLWYQTEFLKYLYPKYLNAKSDQLNVITELLGEEHDLYVLGGTIKNEKLDLDSYEQLVLQNKMDHLRQIIQVKLTPRLRHFFVETPEEFKEKIKSLTG